MTFLFLVGRVILGAYFVYSSYGHLAHADASAGYAASKGVPMPKASVIVSGLMLLFGGLSILTGVLVPVGVLVLIVFLLATLVKMHTFWNVADPMQKMGEQINFTKNLALIGALLMILAIPAPWIYSLVF